MTSFNSQWLLRARPTSQVEITTELEYVDTTMPTAGAGEVIVRNMYLSLDPTNLVWMSDREQYLPPVEIGQVMRGLTIGVVEQSHSTHWSPGDIVQLPNGGWQQYAVADERALRAVDRRDGVPLTAHLSVLGLTGLTAYFGLLDICRPTAGETLVVSAAAGAVGSVAGQIGKIKGCHVVGIAGGPEKCRWIVDELGFDGAIDYKSQDVGATLDRLCPGGVDINFENVGGPIMDTVFSRLNQHGRMALCGMISGYNNQGPLRGPTDFGRILMRRLTVQGFIVLDYFPRAEEAIAELAGWIAADAITWKDDVVVGLDNAANALGRLFHGENRGKLIVEVSPE